MALTFRKLAKLGIWTLRQRGKSHPTHGNYDITGRCTFRCEHCYFYRSYGDERGKNDLTDEQWLARFKADYAAGIRYAYITGGEPALRQNIIKMADNIFDFVVIFSNGTIKIDPAIKRSIFVSLDGPKDVHAKIRGCDAWDKIMANTKGDPRILFTCTLSTTNDKYIDEIYQIAKRQNVCGIMYGFYTPHSENARQDPLYLYGQRRERAIQKLSRLMKSDPDYVFVTKKILQVYRDQRHAPTCSFNVKFGGVVSYYPDGRTKKLCVVGETANCSSCGCPQPVATYCARHLDWRAIKLGEKFLRIQLES